MRREEEFLHFIALLILFLFFLLNRLDLILNFLLRFLPQSVGILRLIEWLDLGSWIFFDWLFFIVAHHMHISEFISPTE